MEDEQERDVGRRLEDGQIKLARFGFNGWTERETRVCTINEEACALIES